MRIRFEETLGLVGVTRTAEVETDSLPPPLREAAEHLIRSLSAVPSDPSQLRDAGLLRFTVTTGGSATTHHRMAWDLPAETQPILDHLRASARPLLPGEKSPQ
jgi:hypothetical protein